MVAVLQPSFAAGELSTESQGRVDIAKYQVGLKGSLNGLIKDQGGWMNRPGFEFLAPAKFAPEGANGDSRLIPFSYNTEQTYDLVFGHEYMWVIRDGGIVLDSDSNQNIVSITAADPAVIEITAHGIADGTWIFVSGIVGMTELNGRFFKTANATANTFTLQDQNDNDIDSSAFTAYSSGGVIYEVYELATPYQSDDLRTLVYAQEANIMTLTHKNYDPYELTRTDHDAWTITASTFEPQLDPPASISVTNSTGSGSTLYEYAVTSESDETGEISFLQDLVATSQNITAITQANPAAVTSTSHGYSTGDRVYIEGVVGMTEVNDQYYTITVTGANDYTLDGVDSTVYTAYVSGGTSRETATCTNDLGTAGNENTITWPAAADADRYNVYKRKNGIYGWIGQSTTNTFVDDNIAPDLTDTPPEPRTPFEGVGNKPRSTVFHQQRKVLAGTMNKPNVIEGTQIGRYNNLSVSRPAIPSDSYTFGLVAKEVQEVRHMLSMRDLLAFTSGGVWKIKGASGNSIEPGNVDPVQQTVDGISELVPPLVVGNRALFVHDLGKTISDIGYNFGDDGYKGDDLTILARHLFKFNFIKDWSWHKEPYRVCWCVRDDGLGLSLTYVREHQIYAWSRHETQGLFRSFSTIREDTENMTYALVDRVIGGQTFRYIERLHSRIFRNIDDCFFVDSGLTRNNWNTDLTSTVTLTGGSAISASDPNWPAGDSLTLTEIGTSSPFVAGDVGREIVLRVLDSDGIIQERCRFEITGYTSATVVTVEPLQAVPESMQGTALYSWGFASAVVSGLWHLEGKSVLALADGDVEGDVDELVVENGEVTLQTNAVQVHIGLSYNADIEMLRITGGAQNGQFVSLEKSIAFVDVLVEETRRIQVAASLEPDIDTGEINFSTYFQRGHDDEEWGEPTALLDNEFARVPVPPEWNNGQFAIRQDLPLPLTVLAVVPEVEIGR